MLIRHCFLIIFNPIVMKALTSIFHRLIPALIAILPLMAVSCDNEDEPPYPPAHAGQTVIMYMPWSGSSIYTYFKRNITAFETAIENNRGLSGNALMVFISENEQRSNLIRITYRSGECKRDTLKSYDFGTCDYTTANGITQILLDAINASPSDTYAMAVGCHGMGWIPKGTQISYYNSRAAACATAQVHPTRYFGHSSNQAYQTDITALAEGIRGTGVKMSYVLFDDCYMSNIETAYDMRGVTDFLIASTCEIMIEGMPYAEIGTYLLNNNLEAVVQGFYDFYSSFSVPCGTIAVTDCNEVEATAQIMKEINSAYPDGVSGTADIQDLDGYTPTIFYDFADYVSRLCPDASLLELFNEQMARLVPYKANTPTYYSALDGQKHTINTFSGLTTSDPTTNPGVAAALTNTAWYEATH